MTKNNDLNEEQLTKATGGTESQIDEAYYVLMKCKLKADIFCIPVKEEQYEDVYKLHRYVRLAYETNDIADRKNNIRLALIYVDRVIKIYSSDSLLDDIKDLLLSAQRLLEEN